MYCRDRSSTSPPSYFSMFTVEELSYTPSAAEQTRDAAQVAATGRKSWKTLRGRGEAVWPPNLEAALIEALEKYKPDETRPAKTARFPLRNKFISDYIYETTRKRRTPKQVGSRLQQLRDTCKDERILLLISRRPIDTDDDSSDDSQKGISSHTPVPASPSPSDYLTAWVNILIDRLTWSSPSPTVYLSRKTDEVAPINIHLASVNSVSGMHATGDGLHRAIPEITIVSPVALAAQSTFSIYLDGVSVPVHTETIRLKLQWTSVSPHAGYSYTSTIAPAFWDTICNNPTQYTVVQQMVPLKHASFHGNPLDNAEAIVNIFYNFGHSANTYNTGTSHGHYTRHSCAGDEQRLLTNEDLYHFNIETCRNSLDSADWSFASESGPPVHGSSPHSPMPSSCRDRVNFSPHSGYHFSSVTQNTQHLSSPELYYSYAAY